MRHAIAVAIATLLASDARADVKAFDSGGVKIAYLDEGKGDAVVLLHGFGGSAVEMWTEMPFARTQFLPVLAERYRVIAPDLRGHGRSDKPHDPKSYGREMAEDVVRMLDHLGVKKAHVVGYSMGAAVAGKLLVSHPDRLLSVTFGGGGPSFRPPDAFAQALDATARSLAKREGIGPLIIALTPGGQERPTAEQAAAFSAMFLEGKDQEALAAVLRGRGGWGVTEAELRANKVPVQFIYGDRDTYMKDVVASSKGVLPACDTLVIEEGDHGSTFTRPEFRKAVLEFLEKNP